MESVQDISKSLILAARDGKLEIVKQLINSYGLSYSKDWSKGYDLLNCALCNNHTEIAKLLLVNGSKVNNTSLVNTSTPLHFAVINSNVEMVKMLLDKGAYVNAKDHRRNTALFYAIENVDIILTKLLLSNRANIENNPKLLINAVEKNCLEIVEALVHYDVDINAFDECGRAALHFTALKDLRSDFSSFPSTAYNFIDIKAEIARLLLNKGANANAQTCTGLTTLHAATEAGFLQVVEVLLEYDADVNICDKNGITALHYTAEKESQSSSTNNDIDVKAKIAKLLLNKGANVNAVTKSGLTTLHIATEKGFLEVVEVLLEYGADINIFDSNGLTALHYAAGKESQRSFTDDDDDEVIDIDVQTKIAKLLLSSGANVDAKTKDGVTALHIATAKGYIKIVETLLEHNANVNCRSPNGFTSLHFAAENGSQEIVNIILKFGADVNSIDESGRTALYIASVKSHLKVTTTLLDHGTRFNFTSVHNQIYFVPHWGEPNSKVRNEVYLYFKNDPINNIYPEFNFLDEEIFDIYKREIIKLECANLYVSNKILELLNFDDMTEYKAECEKEIASMKCEKTDNSNISFYDILLKDTSLLATCMRNESIVQVLQSKNYEKKFPKYAEKIACNLRKVMNRKKLQKKCVEIFHFHVNKSFELSYDCVEKIINYLNNADIKALFNACNHNQEIRWSYTRSNYF